MMTFIVYIQSKSYRIAITKITFFSKKQEIVSKIGNNVLAVEVI